MATKVCNKCRQEKDIEAFGLAVRCKDGRRGTCRVCRSSLTREASIKWYNTHTKIELELRREREREYQRQWRLDNPEAYKANLERHKAQRQYVTLLYRYNHWEEHRDYLRASQRLIKIRVLTHYGGDKCACVKCGESRLDCLSIDHIDGGGCRDQKNRRSGKGLYYRLVRESFPDGFQTLCMNCQWIKRHINKEWGYRLGRKMAKPVPPPDMPVWSNR